MSNRRVGSSGRVGSNGGAPSSVPRARLVTPRGALGVALSLALLVAVMVAVDTQAVLAQLSRVESSWLFVFALASVPQVVALGLRWTSISRGLGLPLDPFTAIREYAIGIALNQSLPTGIAGDALRAFRHGQSIRSHMTTPLPAPSRSAQLPDPRSVLALVLDRVSGQLALLTLAMVAVGVGLANGLFPASGFFYVAATLTCVAIALYATRRVVPRVWRVGERLRTLLARGRDTLFAPRAFTTHFTLSCLFLACTLLQYWAAGRATGVSLSVSQLLWFGSSVLLVISIPTFFAGWGVREGASGALFALAGFAASDGVAIAVMFGLFSFVVGWLNAIVAVASMVTARVIRQGRRRV